MGNEVLVEKAIDAFFRLFPEFDMIEWDGDSITIHYYDTKINPKGWIDYELYSSARELLREFERSLLTRSFVSKTWARQTNNK